MFTQRDPKNLFFSDPCLLLEVFFYLLPEELALISLVNNHFYITSYSPSLWQFKYKQHFPYLTPPEKPMFFRQAFILAYKEEYTDNETKEEFPQKVKRIFSCIKENSVRELFLLCEEEEKLKSISPLKSLEMHEQINGILSKKDRQNNTIGTCASEYDLKIPCEYFYHKNKEIFLLWQEEKRKDFDILSDAIFAHKTRSELDFLAAQGAVVKSGHFFQAVRTRHTDIINWLLEKGLDIETKNDAGNTPLALAVEIENHEAMSILLEHEANAQVINKSHRTPFITAILNSDFEAVKILRAYYPEIDTYWRSAVFIAAQIGAVNMVDYFINAGLNIDAVIPFMGSLIGCAAQAGQMEMVKFLLNKGANVNAHDRGKTALHQAVLGNHLDIIKFLVENNADLEANHNGITPLYYACLRGQIKAAELLLLLGANKNLLTHRGTLIDLARHEGYSSIVALLENADSPSLVIKPL